MRIRRIPVMMAVALATAGVAVTGAAAASASTTGRVPGATTINLASLRPKFAHAKEGPIAGITYPVGHKASRPAAAAACTEPNCQLKYHGGKVQTSPKVYLLFWGPNWSSETSSSTYLESFFQGLGVQPDDTWSTTTDQYTQTGGGHPVFTGSVYAGAFFDTSTPPTGATQTQLGAEADAFASKHGLSGKTNVNIVVATQSGTCPAGFYAPNCDNGNGNYCAWHSSSNEPYTNLPYLLDSGTGCGEDFINGSAGTNDGWSIVGGHEYAETVTDPYPNSGWIDLNDSVSGGEIADKCAWGGQPWGGSDPDGDVTLSTGSFAMQSLWSNKAGKCVMSTTQPDSVVVNSPGNRSNVVGGKYTLTVTGASSGGHPLTWSATGLPAGLSVNASTGVISGKFTTAATYTTTVLAKDSVGATGSAKFTWTVKAATGSAVKGYHSLCLDDSGSWELAANPVDIAACNGSAAQKWSLSSGELHVLGLCLSDTGGAGSSVSLASCKGQSTETWTHKSNGEYALKSNGLCLTDPNSSTAPGTVQVIKACHDAANQKWSGS